MKISAADRRLLNHEGRAIVFDDIHDLAARVDDPGLEVKRRRHSDGVAQRRPRRRARDARVGAHADPGQVLRDGVTDLLRISDARMSGTSYGAVVLHVAPESAVGGPLALVQTGDRIRLDVASRTLDVLIYDAELNAPVCPGHRRH